MFPFLIELGFLDYIQRGRGERIFPELKKRDDDKYSQDASRWFTRYKQRIGITDRKKTFHSMRHTASNALKQAGVEPQLISAILGHATGSISLDRYADPYKPSVLKPVIEMLDFPIY